MIMKDIIGKSKEDCLAIVIETRQKNDDIRISSESDKKENKLLKDNKKKIARLLTYINTL